MNIYNIPGYLYAHYIEFIRLWIIILDKMYIEVLEMKKFIITLLFMFYAITAIGSQEADDILQKDNINITFSPFAYSFFEGSLSDINDNYTYKEQFSDIPPGELALKNCINYIQGTAIRAISFNYHIIVSIQMLILMGALIIRKKVQA